ncbi:MAG TPA: hypothetical protein VFW07_28390 [Parafilimonas sp.]|nr:hypothetical protein [Parafilimonas sp.]
MSSFKRTNSGLTNQHLFHNVDLVVFLEGGHTCYTKAEVYSGSFNTESDDILFWKNIFQVFRPELKIKFKSIGSKTTIKDIAIDIIDGNIKTVMVAMDNEFDEIIGQRFNHNNILYTYGYSWENDIWSQHVIRDVIEELSAIEISSEDINKNFSEFLKKIKLAVYADGYLFSKNSSFFSRPKGFMNVINCQPSDLPNVKSNTIELLITNKSIKKSTAYSFARRKSIDVKKYCYGHLLANYCFQVIMHYLKNRLQLPTLHNQIVFRMAIKKFFQSYFTTSEAYNYFKKEFDSRTLK